eukprot:18724-Heterococcus_DN1.PRE.2
MCDYLTQSGTSTREFSHPELTLTFEDMNPDVVRSCGESVGIASLLRDVCHLEVSESGFVRSPVNSSRCGSGSSEALGTLNSARAVSSAREEPPHFFDAAATCSPLAATPKRAQKLKALKQWLTLNRLLSRSSSTVGCVDDSAAIGHCSGRPATATHRSSRRQRRHSGLVVVPMCTTAQKQQRQQQRQQHSSSSSSTSCSRTRECSPTSSTSSTCTSSPQPHQHSSSNYERQQQLHRQMLPHDALIERHSGFSNLDDWFAEISSPSSNHDSSSTCEDSDIDADEDSDECCRSRRMQTDDPSFYRC